MDKKKQKNPEFTQGNDSFQCLINLNAQMFHPFSVKKSYCQFPKANIQQFFFC